MSPAQAAPGGRRRPALAAGVIGGVIGALLAALASSFLIGLPCAAAASAVSHAVTGLISGFLSGAIGLYLMPCSTAALVRMRWRTSQAPDPDVPATPT